MFFYAFILYEHSPFNSIFEQGLLPAVVSKRGFDALEEVVKARVRYYN